MLAFRKSSDLEATSAFVHVQNNVQQIIFELQTEYNRKYKNEEKAVKEWKIISKRTTIEQMVKKHLDSDLQENFQARISN